MLLLIDLDGTLIYTVHPSWKPYKDGQENYSIEPYIAQVPVFPGAKEFIASRKAKGDSIIIISDSHFRYVNPICDMLGVERVSLADKPNTQKLTEFLDSHRNYKQEIDNGNCFVIGDTKLDIELGRHIGAMTIWFLPYKISEYIKDERDGIGDEMLSKKMGPTFAAKTFQEMESIIDTPLSNLYPIEAAFAGSSSVRAIRLNDNRYSDGSYACIRCLARQEQGACDRFARADKYNMISSPQRTQDFLQSLASGISSYLNQPSLTQGWDYFSYLTDKRTTTPPNKMKEIFDLVATPIQKVRLLKWADNVQGSLREQNLYGDRQVFLQKYLSVECSMETAVDMFGREQQAPIPLMGKNVIILDDQLTTGATAWHVIRKLKEKGARNVLFIAMFQMVLPVNNDVMCPRCGQPMLIKMRRSDGHRFYSCTPPQYSGSGCGYILDVDNNPVDEQFVYIQRNYKRAYDSFRKGRESLQNFKELVVASELDIKLIEKHDVYIRCPDCISDDFLKYVRNIDQRGHENIYSHEKRNKYYRDFTWYSSDNYDHELACLEYSLEHLEELDNYIASLK